MVNKDPVKTLQVSPRGGTVHSGVTTILHDLVHCLDSPFGTQNLISWLWPYTTQASPGELNLVKESSLQRLSRLPGVILHPTPCWEITKAHDETCIIQSCVGHYYWSWLSVKFLDMPDGCQKILARGSIPNTFSKYLWPFGKMDTASCFMPYLWYPPHSNQWYRTTKKIPSELLRILSNEHF